MSCGSLVKPKDPFQADAGFAAQLTRGPWRWPVADGPSWKQALALAPDGPPGTRPGQVALVTVNENGVSLWTFPADTGDSETTNLKGHPPPAWSSACAALTRSLPLLWGSVRDAQAKVPGAASLGSVARHGRIASPEGALEGESFGLALLLSQASRVLGLSLPADFVASATIDPQGELGPVGDIGDKVTAIAWLAPRVTRLLVHKDDVSKAEEAIRGLDSDLTVVPVGTAFDALREVFKDRLEEHIVHLGEDREGRGELVDRLFLLAVRGRQEVLDWTPVAQAASSALSWTNLDEDSRLRLEFAEAVALRHEYNRGTLPLPRGEWLTALPRDQRLNVLSHFVQHAADTGTPDPAQIRQLAEGQLKRGLEAVLPHLRLLGALARLRAVTGEAEDALRMQTEAAEGFLTRDEAGEVSYPISECFRLAGALRDQDAFGQAEAIWRQALARGAGEHGTAYVDLARARALVGLGDDSPQIEESLRHLCAAENKEAHVRWAAHRWWVRHLDGRGKPDATGPLIASLRTAADGGGHDAETAQTALALIELDRALRAHDAGRAGAAVETLRQIEPGPISLLLDTATNDNTGAHIARFYPY